MESTDKYNKPFADYSNVELVDYLVKRYPYGKIEKLKEMFIKGEIGSLLYNTTRIILEGIEYD